MAASAAADCPRLAEVVGALSLATDVGSGQPFGQGLRAAVLAVRLAEVAGADEAAAVDVYYLALLRYIGCTTDSHIVADVFGDELAAGAWFAALDNGNPASVIPGIVRHQGVGLPAPARARQVLATLAGLPKMREVPAAHCEVAKRLAARFPFSAGVQDGVGQLMIRFDGRASPARWPRGEQINRSARIAMLARDAAVLHRAGGSDGAREMARRRSGGAHDPSLVAALLGAGPAIFDGLDRVGWEDALAAEPGDRPVLRPLEVQAALEAMADFVDLKFPTLAGHSRGVAALAEAAARIAGLPDRGARELGQAGLVHDLGRVTVSAGVWQRPGRLSDDDWEKVRLHPYHTERLLARCQHLSRLGSLGSLHHERLDGSGYHRGAAGADLGFEGRLLAAADAFCAMTEPRPHRDALTAEAAADELRHQSRRGRLDANAVNAVCAAAGQRGAARHRSWPAGLTDREVEVLGLLAQGHPGPEVARRLHLSPKTVGRHVENTYTKIGVSTRAAAVLFAMEYGLIRGAAREPEPKMG